MNYSELQDKLIDLIKKSGLKHGHISEKCGVSMSFFSLFFNKKLTSVSTKFLFELAEVLGVGLSFSVSEKG